MRLRKQRVVAAGCLLGMAVTLHCRAGTEQGREPVGGGGQPAAREPSAAARAYSLTAGERAHAVELADRVLHERNLIAAGPIFVVDVDLIRDKVGGSEEGRRGALVTHYRYAGDLAIITHVDLAESRVLQVETIPHLSVPLAEEELKRAQQMGLADQGVRRALGSNLDHVVVQALVLRAAAPQDPIYGHRVVRLLFKVGRDYLSQPVVLVDLSAGKVTLQPAMPQPREEHP